MADISKINAVLIANIAEIDDVLAANIAKVNGLVFSTAPAFTGLLDTYTGAAAAYSTRRLYSLYTGAAMRVREDSGDTETDIGFDANGDLDTAAIASHCGTANGYVTKWYGQESSGGTGSGNDAEQSTVGNQPQIYNGTAVLTENGQPILRHDSGNTHLNLSFAGNSTCWMFTVTDINTGIRILLSDSGTYEFIMAARDNDSTTHASIPYTNIYKNSSLVTYTTQDSVWDDINQQQNLHVLQMNTSNVASYQLGLSAASAWASYDMQEVIIYHSDESSNRTGIESNINTYFSIY